MSFQLFPPPPKKQKQISLKRPAQPASPEPAVELLERAKAPVDFHELIIKVNSNPSSPISAPSPAHVGSSSAGKSQPKVVIPETTKHTSQSDSPQTRSRSSTLRSGDGRATPNSGGTVSRSPDTNSPIQQPSISGDTISPLYQVDRQTSGSPSFSDSSTLVRTQSTATHRTKLSQTSPKEAAVMHSIFPRYNPNLPLAQQHYRPTQQSPTHIPKDKISRKPYSPTFYVPHANVLRSGSAEEPYYTPKIELGALWDASNGKARPEAKRTYSLQMHCRKASPDSSPIDGETFVFGSSPIQPFYSLEQALADHAAGASGDPQACEVLISRNHPTQARSNPLPVAHLEIQTPPPHAPAPPPEIFYQHPERIPQATHITTIHPKLATLAALEAAAQSPRASTIATFDPTAESPEAAQLASEVVADCEARNACQLFYCPVSEPLMPPYEMNKTGTYELRHPTLGAFPVVVQGDIKKSLDASSKAASTPGGGGGTSNGQSARSTSPMRHIPTTVTLLNPFAAPRSAPQTPEQSSSLSPPTKRPTPQPLQTRTSSPNRPPTPAPDEVLARLSLHTAALTIDAAAIAALGTDKSSPHAHTPHPYLIDVAVSAVLAVLVAERRRAGDGLEVVVLPAGGGTPPPPPGQPPGENTVYGGGQWPTGSTGSGGLMVFAGPPTAAARSSAWPGQKGAKAQIREKVRPLSWSWWFGGDAAKEAEKRARREAKAERKARQGRKGVVDIELGNGPGGAQAVERGGAEGKGKERYGERMHWTVELVLALLAFAFKAVVFVLGLVFKILGRLIVKLNKCAAKA